MTSALLIASGCNNQNDAPNTSNEGTKPTTENVVKETPAPEVRGNITVSMYERNNIPPEEGNWDKNRWTQWINENGPTDVSYITVPRWESLQKFNTLFASNAAPDLILEYDTGYRNQWYGQKLLMPIDELIEEHSTTYKSMLEQFPQLRKLGTKDDGKLYEIGKVSPLSAGHMIYIRQDWLDKLGLPMPKTAEDFLAVAKAFAEDDPDDNGKKDTFALNLSGNAYSILNHMFGYGEVMWRFEGEDFVHEWDRLKTGVAFQKQLFDAGTADKDFLADKNGEKAKQDFLIGKLGMYLWQGMNDNDYDTFKQNNPNGKLAILPLPSSEFGQFSPVSGSPIQMVGAINAATKDPKSVIQYIDFMMDPSNAITIQFGLEGTHWEKNDKGCPVPIDPEKNKIEVSYTGDLGMMASQLLYGKCAFSENKTQVTETKKAIAKLYIDAEKAYISKDRPIPTLKPEYLPVLPQDLSIIVKNVEQQMKDQWLRAIVSGAGYTADQAYDDAKKIWDGAGGKQVDEFYANWYKENKANAFLLEDLYQFGEDARALYSNK